MLTEGTPGPWVTARWDSDPEPEIATIANVGQYRVGIPTPGFPGGNYRDAQYGSDEADARLIAAVPQLLKACRQAIVALRGREHDGFLRDAIEQATGVRP